MTADATSMVEMLADRLAIEDLWNKYAIGLDTGDYATVLETFSEDAVFNVAGTIFNGREEIRSFVEQASSMTDALAKDPNGRRFLPVRHLLTNLTVTLEGDTAHADSFWTEIVSTGRFDGGWGKSPKILNAGRYEDRFVKRGGKWFIQKRHVIADLFGPIVDTEGYATPFKDAPSFPDNDHPTEWSL